VRKLTKKISFFVVLSLIMLGFLAEKATLVFKSLSLSKQKSISRTISNSEATRCAQIDLSPQFGAIRDQEQLGWCYAFVAADLLGVEMGLSPKEQISAFDIGIHYYDFNAEEASLQKDLLSISEDYKKAFQGAIDRIEAFNVRFKGVPLEQRRAGYLTEAIAAYTLRGGVCLESNFPSQKEGVKNYIVSRVKEIETEALKREKAGGPIQKSDACLRIESDADKFVSFFTSEKTKKAKRAACEVGLDAVHRAADSECGKLIEFEKTLVPSTFSKKERPVVEVVNERLDLEQSQPVGIIYNPCKFYKPKAFGDKDKRKDECIHASIVAGRRPSGKKDDSCEYLVRNSWGKKCTMWSADIQKKCVDGQFWVNEKDLESAVTHVVHFER
jgi:hypothetical protein